MRVLATAVVQPRSALALRTVALAAKGDVVRIAFQHFGVMLRGSSMKLHTQPKMWTKEPKTLCDYGAKVLSTSDPQQKATITQDAWEACKNGMPVGPITDSDWTIGDNPARPETPQLRDLKEMPSVKQAGVSQSVFLLHGLAHIEFNAMNMYWDTLVRFYSSHLPTEFYYNILEVAHDEARHFCMLESRLKELGSHYGALPAHKRLWEHAVTTKNDLEGRIAMVPLVQEARGLDSGPRLIHKLKTERDKPSAEIVGVICSEEEKHVNIGMKWFRFLCRMQKVDPATRFHQLVLKYQDMGLPEPFNKEAREAAGMPADWYEPLAISVQAQIRKVGGAGDSGDGVGVIVTPDVMQSVSAA